MPLNHFNVPVLRSYSNPFKKRPFSPRPPFPVLILIIIIVVCCRRRRCWESQGEENDYNFYLREGADYSSRFPSGRLDNFGGVLFLISIMAR